MFYAFFGITIFVTMFWMWPNNSLISYELTSDIGLQENQLTFFFVIPK